MHKLLPTSLRENVWRVYWVSVFCIILNSAVQMDVAKIAFNKSFYFKLLRSLRLVLLGYLVFFGSILLAVEPETDCKSCHENVYTKWQQSDHAKSMDIADKDSVLGDFSGVAIQHYSQRVVFFIKDAAYYADLSEAGSTSRYQLKFTFGHYPLQQYLVEKSGGRLQVFPFAWDARPVFEGGQRWFPNYAQEDVQTNDRLHWQQALQNWNGMCADCHSDGFKRHYSAKSDSFASHWDNINVGCQSCHSETPDHVKNKPSAAGINKHIEAKQSTALNDNIVLAFNGRQTIGQWIRGEHENVAHWQGEERDNQFMENCFACHSLRSPLTDGIDTRSAFLDQFSPSLIVPSLYHVDGQIKAEVYVYGSFLQSKMFAAGVNCLDCHDSHTIQVKTPGNALCSQCHNAKVYQQPTHTRHQADSEGGQCVNCHMPQTTYMGVDKRRDHSFTIPRPDLSIKYATPNACNQCHQDQSLQWSVNALEKWFGQPEGLSAAEQGFRELLQGGSLSQKQHIALINDKTLSVIKRASALALLGNSVPELSDKLIKPWVNSDQPLLRLASAKIGYLLPVNERLKSFTQLLGDKYKAIRVAAANQLLDVGLHNNPAFTQAFKELVSSNEMNQWRGEGSLNQSLIHMRLRENDQAIAVLLHGIKVDPYFEPNYVNLAEIYRVSAKPELELGIIQQALQAVPDSALFHYNYGMWFIRQQQKGNAVIEFRQATTLAPNNEQFAYMYFLGLDANGDTLQALRELKSALKHYNNNAQLIQLGLSFAQKLNDRVAFDELQKSVHDK
jgi:predicted CXXCH cytochrome family protein